MSPPKHAVACRPVAGGILTLVAALVAGLLAACGGSASGGPVTLRFVWWGNEDRAKATQSAVALFEKNNPGITVHTEYSGYTAYFQKLATEVAGGDSPDLVQVDRDSLGEYQQKGVLLDLDSAVGNALHVTGLPKQLLDSGKVAGKLYAVAAGQTTQMLVYDPALWQRAGVQVPTSGWTWEQFGADVQKVGAATGTPGTTDFGWAIDWFEVWLAEHGKKLYTADHQLGFTQQDLTAFWNLTGALRQQGGVSKPEATTKMDGSTQNSALVLKQSASEFNYDSNLTGYLSSYSTELKAAPLPTDTRISGLAAMPPVSYAVAQRSAHTDAAIKLLDFLTNDPAAGRILGTTRGLPPNLTTRSQVCAAAGTSKAVCDYENSVSKQIGPSFGNWPTGASAIKRDFQQVYDDVIFGRTNVAAGAARVIADARQSLSQS